MQSSTPIPVTALCAACLPLAACAASAPFAPQGRDAAARAADLAGNIGWFGGLAAGRTDFSGYELEAQATELDDTDLGWMAFAGYQVHPFLALAGGWVDLGSLQASGPAFGGFRDEIAADGVALMSIGVLPVRDNVAAYAIAGAFRWDQSVDYVDPGETYSGSSSGTSPMFGLGFNWYPDALEKFGINLAVLHFPKVGDLDVTGHEDDVTMVTLGALLHIH